MNRNALTSARTHLAAAAVAVVVTVLQLGGIETLAQQRHVSAHAQVVQLDRVTVTGQRAAARPVAARVASSCQAVQGAVC